MKYKVLNQSVVIAGTIYKPGDTLELTAKQFESVHEGLLEEATEPKPPKEPKEPKPPKEPKGAKGAEGENADKNPPGGEQQ